MNISSTHIFLRIMSFFKLIILPKLFTQNLVFAQWRWKLLSANDKHQKFIQLKCSFKIFCSLSIFKYVSLCIKKIKDICVNKKIRKIKWQKWEEWLLTWTSFIFSKFILIYEFCGLYFFQSYNFLKKINHTKFKRNYKLLYFCQPLNWHIFKCEKFSISKS